MELFVWALKGGYLTVCESVLAEEDRKPSSELGSGNLSFRQLVKYQAKLHLLYIVRSDNEEVLEWYCKEFEIDFKPQRHQLMSSYKRDDPKLYATRVEAGYSMQPMKLIYIFDISLHCLTLACKEGHDTAMAETLLRLGVNAQFAEDHRNLPAFSKVIDLPPPRCPPLTPLEYACKRGNLQMVRLLLDNGAYLDDRKTAP